MSSSEQFDKILQLFAGLREHAVSRTATAELIEELRRRGIETHEPIVEQPSSDD